MPYTAISKPSVGDPTKKTAFADAVLDNLDYLNSQLTYTTGGTRILNGSFEQDTDSDGVPDGWAENLFTGGSSTHDTTTQDLGAKSYKFTSPGGGGNGGGYLESSDYFEVSPAVPLAFTWQMKSSVAGVKNNVIVYWFKPDKTASATPSSTIFTEATNNPTAWAQLGALCTAPSDATFAKLRIVGCDNTDATAGSTWFDDVAVTPLLFSRRCEVNVAGNYSWVCPSGVYVARVRCVGPGGGGGAANTSSGITGSGGGAGGVGQSLVLVVPGTAYDITVGAGGAGGSGNAGNGGAGGSNTTFNTTTVIGALGGGGVGGGGSAGAGGTGTGQITLTGGSGNASGNGGSSASPGGAAGAAPGQAGGAPGAGGAGGVNGVTSAGGSGGAGGILIEF